MSGLYPSLHVIGSRQFGGADQFYVRLVRALAAAGQPVTAVNRAGTPIAQALADGPVEQIHLPLANGWDAWSMWKLRRLVAARRPAIVQTYMGRATRLTRLSRSGGSVHVARLGGYYKIDGYYRHAHAWIGNTKGLCDYLVREGLPAERVFHIGNFVPDPFAHSTEELAKLLRDWHLPEDAILLFTLGRLIDIKGFDDLLRALARLPGEIGGRPWRMLIAGDGPLAADLKAQTTELGLEGHVIWLGWQDPPDPFYALADAFICPSRRETLGNVILEAWNYGRPVIATRTPGALELVTDGERGLLCDIGDDAQLAACIIALLSASPQERVALGAAGQRYLRDHFGREAILAQYLDLYQRLCGGG